MRLLGAKANLLIVVLACAVCACAVVVHRAEFHETAVGKAPVHPYQRIYVLANFTPGQDWFALPLADRLNKALTAKGKAVASEIQYVDPIALAPGPNLKNAREFRPDGTVICHLLRLRQSSQYIGDVEIECDLVEGISDVRVWSGRARFALRRDIIEPVMDGIATDIVQHLTQLQAI